jgi:peptidoglycan/LPS O-acetylase OafA/YrhL
MLVVFQHFGTNYAPGGIKSLAFQLETGTLAVAAFFTVSGFVIVEAAELFYPHKSMRFIANRTLRIFPLFAVSLLIAISVDLMLAHIVPDYGAALAAAQPGKFAPSEIMLNLAMILDGLNLFRIYANHPFIVAAWTLRQEFFFYLIVFAAMTFGTKTHREALSGFRQCLTAFSLLFLILFGVNQAGILNNLSFEYAPYFVFGGAWYYRIGTKCKSSAVSTTLLVLSAIEMVWQQQARVEVTTWYVRDPTGQMALLVGLVIAFCVLSTKSLFPFSRWLGPDSKAGDLTFAIYLNHQTVLTAMACFFAPGLMTFLGGIVVSVIFSFLVHLGFEPPISRLRNRVRGGKIRVTTDREAGDETLSNPTFDGSAGRISCDNSALEA